MNEIKVIAGQQEFIFKSYFVQEVVQYIFENSKDEFRIFIGYSVASHTDILGLYLTSSKDYGKYLQLHKILYTEKPKYSELKKATKLISIFDYGKNTQKTKTS